MRYTSATLATCPHHCPAVCPNQYIPPAVRPMTPIHTLLESSIRSNSLSKLVFKAVPAAKPTGLPAKTWLAAHSSETRPFLHLLLLFYILPLSKFPGYDIGGPHCQMSSLRREMGGFAEDGAIPSPCPCPCPCPCPFQQLGLM